MIMKIAISTVTGEHGYICPKCHGFVTIEERESGKCPTCEMVKDSIAHSREARTPLERCNTCGGFVNRIGACPNCGQVCRDVSPDTRIRRRIEDLIRKDPVVLKKVANYLEIT